jgi:hypothetical protein
MSDLERGQGAEVFSVTEKVVLLPLLVVAAGERAVEAGEGVHYCFDRFLCFTFGDRLQSSWGRQGCSRDTLTVRFGC